MDERDNNISKPSASQINTAAPAGPGSTSTGSSGAGGSRAQLRAQEQAKRKAAAQQRLLFMMLGAALALNMVLAYFLYGIMVQGASRAQEQALMAQELDKGSSKIQQFITSNQQKLNELAQNPALLQAFTDNNRGAFSVFSQSLLTQFEQPLDLRVFVAGEADVDPNGAVPIRFTELDLIHRAEHGEQVFPEAVLINEAWQIHFIAAIATAKDQPALGTLMLTLDAQQLKKTMAAMDASLGETLVQQQFAKAATQTLFKLGAGGTALVKEKEIPQSHWQLKFTASPTLVQRAEEQPALWILAICGSTALSLLLAMLLSRLLVRWQKVGKEQLAPSMPELAAKPAAPGADAGPSPLFQPQDILDITVIDEDENILGLQDSSTRKPAASASKTELQIPAHIFRSYDIRGVVGKDLTPELAEHIGQAVGSEALDQGESSLIVARDGRTHSEQLTSALIAGILRSGCNVINVGVVPTPVMYFATYYFDDVRSGVMVTASHNPAEYNGFKVVINNNALSDERVLGLRERILSQRLHQGLGEESARAIIPHYIERIFSDVALAGDVSIVIDAGNAVPGIVAPQLFEELGCHVTPLFCELDGSFPNHEPDPTQEQNLTALIAKVQEVKADIGVAFDGDGDRLVVVTPKGDIIWPDRLLMLFAKDILARNPGADVLFDVKCSRQLNQVISGYGGRPIMWKTGHSPMKAKMVETGALIGGEYSGHIFIKDRWYGFDDGIYAMARLLEIITLRDQNIDDIFAAFPPLLVTPEIKVAVPDQSKFELIKKLAEQADFQSGNITTIDGIRVDYSKGWGLVRASNTSPALTLRFEAESQEALDLIKQIFKRELLKADSNLVINF